MYYSTLHTNVRINTYILHMVNNTISVAVEAFIIHCNTYTLTNKDPRPSAITLRLHTL